MEHGEKVSPEIPSLQAEHIQFSDHLGGPSPSMATMFLYIFFLIIQHCATLLIAAAILELCVKDSYRIFHW